MEQQESEVLTSREVDVAIRPNGDGIVSPLAQYSSHAPIGKVPVKILAEIFVQCLLPSSSFYNTVPKDYKSWMHPQIFRQRLGEVCQLWNTIVDNEPRIWAKFVLYTEFLDPEMVSLWIKKSKSHPLDVFLWSKFDEKKDERRAILSMLHGEIWRIRILCGIYSKQDMSLLFPCGVSTEAPMMQTLLFWGRGKDKSTDTFGEVHCPQLHSLTVFHSEDIILFVKPMTNLHRMDIDYLGGSIHLYLKLLDLSPNLVSLRWRDVVKQPKWKEPRRVNLPSLRFLSIECGQAKMTSYLTCFLNESPDTLSCDGNIGLRWLMLNGAIPTGTKLHAILNRLKHLTTLILHCQNTRDSVNGLLLALSPLDQDFSSVCPQLRTVELRHVAFTTNVLDDFVKRRVKSDLEHPTPDLVTSLTLTDDRQIGEELRAQFAQTYSSSITFNEIPFDYRTKVYRCCGKYME